MRREFLLSSLLLLATALPAQQGTALDGFSSQASRTEIEWERKFRAIPSTDNLRSTMKLLTARPHSLGSAYNRQNEEWIVSQFRQWGWETQVESFDVLFPTPLERVVELVEPQHIVAKLQEPAVPGDPTSDQQAEQLPPYNAYSIDGDVTAPLIYANYGLPADYEQLERRGISVRGAVVIVRYGESWRGIKPKLAAEHGAVGCLIYSDPQDDGFAQGEVFPKGGWRPADGVQRGSVMDLSVSPGDPLTPGVGATPDAKRLPIKDVTVFTKIPVMPLSYGDAQPLLAAMGGPVAPANWRGALGITYHMGPGLAKVHLRVKSNWEMKTIHDIVARMPGAEAPDEWVIRGNHYDAWVNGAQDPVAGLSAALEEARALGELRKAGWKPKRTILYIAWDGEEAGLLGSTEWVETHAEELRAHAVAYINSDTNSRGYLDAAGSQTLKTFVNQIARDIDDPEKGGSVWQRKQQRRIATTTSPDERQALRAQTSWPIDALGSGSDYTPFLDFLGVAALNFGYSGEANGGNYHSAYDDFYWYTHFGDTAFTYGRALAQTAGTAVMRLADADLLPMSFSDLSSAVRGYLNDIERLAERQSKQIRDQNREASDELLASGRSAGDSAANKDAVVPRLDFGPMEKALAALDRSAGRYQRAFAKAGEGNGARLNRASLGRVNQEVMLAERALIDPAGLPNRPWFKHQLYAPGLYTGYSSKTIPAVREAIEQKEWALAQQSIGRVARVLQGEAEAVERAAVDLERAAE